MAGRRPVAKGSPEERFWTFVDRAGPDDCWLWNGGCFKSGYGEFTDEGPCYAHRYVYELIVGPIPEGLVIDHTCHNADPTCEGGACLHRRCVNPAHLEPVTNTENLRRGRNRT